MATVREHNSPETHFNKFAFQSQLSDPHIKHRPLVLRRSINKKMMKTERSPKAPPMSPATRLNTSINDRNQTQASIKTRKFTLRQLDDMERDVFVLTNPKTNLMLPERQCKTDQISPQSTYRRFQRCSFFDREAIYHPKKQHSHQAISNRIRGTLKDASISSDSASQSQQKFTVPKGDVSAYMESIMKTPNKKLSRFAVKLSERIRNKFLKDIKEYNFSNMKSDIELSKINDSGLWIDQFDDLKNKLVHVQTNEEMQYRKSICTRNYDPYLQYLAMTNTEKRMIRKVYCYDFISPKRILQ